jgi:hypothetical protein
MVLGTQLRTMADSSDVATAGERSRFISNLKRIHDNASHTGYRPYFSLSKGTMGQTYEDSHYTREVQLPDGHSFKYIAHAAAKLRKGNATIKVKVHMYSIKLDEEQSRRYNQSKWTVMLVFQVEEIQGLRSNEHIKIMFGTRESIVDALATHGAIAHYGKNRSPSRDASRADLFNDDEVDKYLTVVASSAKTERSIFDELLRSTEQVADSI